MRPLSKECELILKRYFFPEDIVIVSPLNWGIGHATRCIPLIHFLKKYCREVIIASDGQALEILKREFSDLTTYETPSYNIKYKYENALLNMLAMLPFIINGIIREKGSATMLTKKFNATVIFSDNRLGFLDKNVRNIYMTHQINILHPNRIISWIAGKLHQWFINKFDLCLVPDYQDFKRSVSGKLSFSKAVKNCQYLGPIHRVSAQTKEKLWDICILLSGPEPQRSVLEEKLLAELADETQYKIILVRGVSSPFKSKNIPGHIKVKNLITSGEIEEVLNSSKLLISRSGYSTIMDILEIDINAIFVPTPGQTEQEYLGERMAQNPKYRLLKQGDTTNITALLKELL